MMRLKYLIVISLYNNGKFNDILIDLARKFLNCLSNIQVT